ncbi:TPA: DUF551 domain-containing protein [Salmonella enterica]|uniref:DUF551 domain-containing protein n=1 Tax=Salmonella enterica TaxID=28901 RepID=A0A749Z9N5_SALER|nr:DUF551 domain-containing protein [Salmonella enterica]ELA5277344.1 DUF551 domain-containing protein [Salmonella enterica subsp. enterica serovar Newport]HAF6042751.1 DUF551 domain-containing protein [Salmonella enterica]HAK7668778.1 DUF551 domain-containing protein [Salmonella enterica]
MTTITKERIELFIKNPLENGLTRGEQMELARIAMASLDAEPVRYLNKFSGVCVTLEQQPNAADDVAVYIPLYAAPPAPVVPEECPAELPYAQVKAVADLFALCWQSGEVVTYTPDPEKATIWLNNYSGTCVQEYVKLERLQEALAGNSPVTQDGWISCSERMPEDEQEVIVHNKLGYRYVSYFDEHSGLFFDMRGGNQMNCIEHILVTHWMPLPAAPEPEQS